jgi:heme exporter protein A
MGNGNEAIFSGEAVGCVRGARRVFNGLDFTLRSGDALVLTGPNGSGKSSLLRLMAGLSAPASGAVLWNGSGISKDREAHAARTHYVGHVTATKPALTTAEDLAFWSAFRLAEDTTAQERALDHFGLSRRARFPVRFLSSGQKRRLALARLLAAPAPLWLLDEPTVGLDSQGQRALETAIADHRAGGGIVVLASHVSVDLGGTVKTLNLADFSVSAGPEAGA